jgi:hypothetical protein
MRRAYEPLFSANEKAHEMPLDQLKGLVAQVAGTDSDMTAAIAYTFNALAKLANFNETKPLSEANEEPGENQPKVKGSDEPRPSDKSKGNFRPEFNYNIQVHLPSNGTEETYLHIFNAIRKALQ